MRNYQKFGVVQTVKNDKKQEKTKMVLSGLTRRFTQANASYKRFSHKSPYICACLTGGGILTIADCKYFNRVNVILFKIIFFK